MLKLFLPVLFVLSLAGCAPLVPVAAVIGSAVTAVCSQPEREINLRTGIRIGAAMKGIDTKPLCDF